MSTTITITDEDLALLLKALGRYKTWQNDGGFYRSAHSTSELMARIKNNTTTTKEVTNA